MLPKETMGRLLSMGGVPYVHAKTTALPMGLDTFSISMKNMEHYCTWSTQA